MTDYRTGDTIKQGPATGQSHVSSSHHGTSRAPSRQDSQATIRGPTGGQRSGTARASDMASLSDQMGAMVVRQPSQKSGSGMSRSSSVTGGGGSYAGSRSRSNSGMHSTQQIAPRYRGASMGGSSLGTVLENEGGYARREHVSVKTGEFGTSISITTHEICIGKSSSRGGGSSLKMEYDETEEDEYVGQLYRKKKNGDRRPMSVRELQNKYDRASAREVIGQLKRGHDVVIGRPE